MNSTRFPLWMWLRWVRSRGHKQPIIKLTEDKFIYSGNLPPHHQVLYDELARIISRKGAVSVPYAIHIQNRINERIGARSMTIEADCYGCVSIGRNGEIVTGRPWDVAHEAQYAIASMRKRFGRIYSDPVANDEQIMVLEIDSIVRHSGKHFLRQEAAKRRRWKNYEGTYDNDRASVGLVADHGGSDQR